MIGVLVVDLDRKTSRLHRRRHARTRARLFATPLLVTTLALGLGACGGSARVLTHDGEGGLFALDGDRGAARQDAERQMREHCGGAGYDVVFEGDVQVGEEDTHELSAADRVAQTQTVQSGDHTSWVEGTEGSYSQSGVQMSTESGEISLYDTHRGDRAHGTRTVTERHLEYECEQTSGGESP